MSGRLASSPSTPSSRKRPRPAPACAVDRLSASDQSAAKLLAVAPRLSLRCCYRSKQCHNERALKLNGENHKLCEYHRRRANLNQQRVHQRRKMRLKQSERLACSPRSETDATGTPCDTMNSHCDAGLWKGAPEPYEWPCGDLAVCDLIILKTLLFNPSPPPSPRQYSQGSPTVSIIYADGVKREL